MANLPDGSGDAYSNIVQGKGTASLAFTMPATVPLAITSIVATVDNAAGADTYATLTYADSSGQVIAKKRQGVVIPAGGSGTATWALRLDDETPAASSAVTGQLGVYLDSSRAITPANNDVHFSFALDSGAALLDLTFPTFPSFVTAGVYVVTAWAAPLTLAGAAGKSAALKMFQSGPGNSAATASQTVPLDALGSEINVSATIPRVAAAGDLLQVTMAQDAVTSTNFQCVLNVVKIG